MFDLKIGCNYEVICTYFGKDLYRNWSKYEGKIIYIDNEIVVFNNGKFNICQMIKDYKKLWRAKQK